MKLMAILSFGLIMTLFSYSCKDNKPVKSNLSLVPYPNRITELKTGYSLENELIIDNSQLSFSVDPIISLLKNHFLPSLEIVVKENISKGSNLLFISDSALSSESYNLRIDGKGIKITAADYNGFFYATQTLIQLFDLSERKGDKVLLQGVDIVDQPAFKWRGMHLDVCRHFFGVTFIKKMLDGMAMHKLNVFHWHLTDDQGWRIEIKKYPELTTIAAWRDETIIGHQSDSPKRFDGIRHGGIYSQDEIKEVVDYASKLGITVVPEIEMPGHAVAALTAYPQFSCTGGPIKPFNEWGVSDDVYCAGKESTFIFLEDVLAEVIELFPGEYIHTGGDECPKARWKECPDCQKRIKNEGLKDETELQSYFTRRIEKYLNSRGKKLIGWDEILEGGIAENAAVMSWRGEEGAIEAASLGHEVVMTPNAICYLDHYQSENNEPLAFGELTTMDEIYNWSVIPKDLDPDKQKLILGAQANLWTEYIPNEKQVEYMLFPRLCALSEIVWTKKENLDYNDFISRMSFHYSRLEKNNINYRKPTNGTK